MIALNPVEQNIDKVTLVSSNLYATGAHEHHTYVIMKNGGPSLSSFTIDGVQIQSSQLQTHPNIAGYSYLYLSNVTQGYHRISADSVFNAIADGYEPADGCNCGLPF